MASTDDPDHEYVPFEGHFELPGILIPFYPDLAVQIGINESLLLVQLGIWINALDDEVEEIEGVRWLKLSAQQMIDFGFEHLSPKTIDKIVDRLAQRDLVQVKYSPGSKTRWLTLNYENIEALGVEIDIEE